MLQIFANSKKACQDISSKCSVPNIAINCKDKDAQDIAFMFPKIKSPCLCAGVAVLNKFAHAGYIGKNLVLGSVRGKPHYWADSKVVFTHDPYVASQDHQASIDSECDIKLAERIELTGSAEPKLGKYVYVDDFTTLCKYVKAQGTVDNPVFLTCDLETTGLIYSNPSTWIVSISFTWDVGKAHVKFFGYAQLGPISELHAQIKWLLTTNRVKLGGANFKYDIHWLLAKWGIPCRNFTLDTNLLGSLLDENASNSLGIHAKRFTAIGGYDDSFNMKYDKSKMELVPKGDMLDYTGGDTDACYRVAGVLKSELLKDPALARFYVKLLHPAVRAFEMVEQNGILIDVEYMGKLQVELEKSIGDLEGQALGLMSRFLHCKYAGEKDGKKNLRLSRPAVIKDFMFGARGLNLTPLKVTPKSKQPSTALEHLMMFAGYPKAEKFIGCLKKYNSAAKTLSTYVIGFMKHLNEDGRFHPSFQFFKGDFGDSKSKEAGTVCVTADTLFLTDRGQIPAVQVEVGQQVITHTGQRQLVTDLIYNGIQDIIKVTTDSGLSLCTNKVHPYQLETGQWVDAHELKSGDVVRVYGDRELWRVVPAWGHYEVSNWGRIRHDKFGIVKAHIKNEWGHLKVTLAQGECSRANDSKKDFGVHQVVARAWLPPKPRGRCIWHLNGIPWDNAYWNLVWATQLENKQDDINYGTSSKVETSQAKLDWGKVKLIHSSRLSDSAMGVSLGVSRELVRDVRNGKRWVRRKITIKRVLFKTAIVVSVEPDGCADTFGITVSGDHSHVTNGFITHNTGRSSAVAPAIQTLPKHTIWAKKLRKAYTSLKGWFIVNWDYSQGELRIAADVANETTMLQMYKNDIDQHMATGGKMLGYSISDMLDIMDKDPDLFAKIRQQGKAGNFGLLYGVSAKGFREYSRTTFGVIITLKQAEQMRDTFFDLYPRLLEWHSEQIKYAYAHGMVRSPLGRIRHLPMIYSKDQEIAAKARRQSINSPVQATLSDLTIYALSKIKEQVPETFFDYCKFHCFTHDSLTAYVYGNVIPTVVPTVTKIMETLPLEEEFGWKPKVFFKVDSEVGKTWADLVKYDKWLAVQKSKIVWTKPDDLPF